MAVNIIWKRRLWNGRVLFYGDEVLGGGSPYPKEYRDIGQQIIRAGRRILARTHHPDVSPTPESLRKMAVINLVADTLLKSLK